MVRIERRILSPTAINTYLSCPRKYYLRYIRKLRTKSSIHLIRGNLIHKAIQAFHKECARGPPNLSETGISESLLKTFNRLWLESQNDLVTLGLSQDELDEYHDDSERMLLNYACWFTRQDNRSTQSKDRLVQGTGLPLCIQSMLQNGVAHLQRSSCFRLAVQLRKIGLPFDATVSVLKTWALKNKPADGKRIITDHEIIEQASCAYSKYYKAYGCETSEMEPFCRDDCPLKRKS